MLERMKNLLTILALLACSNMAAVAQIYTGPIPRPTSGYGAEGSYSVVIEAFPNPNYPTEDIRIYHPAGIATPVPTIFYSHGFGGFQPQNVLGLLEFVVRKGYAIVFVPYQTAGVTSAQRYDNLLSGFMQSARDFPNIIDTTRVGFMGHSFGGGSVFANAYHCFTQLNWGQAGRFLFASAQWYSLNISQAELLSYPSDVKLLTLVYENDSTNDHRMANDMFNNINIPASEKDYLRVKTDTVSGHIYQAIHGVPNTASDYNALDFYAIYRILDALCDYTFNGSLAGKDVALGNGSANQVGMPGGLHDLVHSDAPSFAMPQSIYNYPCDAFNNPRRTYCEATVSVGEAAPRASLYPNPASSAFHIVTDQAIAQVELLDTRGRMVMEAHSPAVDIADLPSGLYLVKVVLADGSCVVEKLLKE
jgi:Secretion system C-terminal sorting domain